MNTTSLLHNFMVIYYELVSAPQPALCFSTALYCYYCPFCDNYNYVRITINTLNKRFLICRPSTNPHRTNINFVDREPPIRNLLLILISQKPAVHK